MVHPSPLYCRERLHILPSIAKMRKFSYFKCLCQLPSKPPRVIGCTFLTILPQITSWLSSMVKKVTVGLMLQSCIVATGDVIIVSTKYGLAVTGAIMSNPQRVLGLKTSYTHTYPPTSQNGVSFISVSFRTMTLHSYLLNKRVGAYEHTVSICLWIGSS